jgi:hypothetical protein
MDDIEKDAFTRLRRARQDEARIWPCGFRYGNQPGRPCKLGCSIPPNAWVNIPHSSKDAELREGWGAAA